MDLSKFFDTVNHDALMLRVARKVRDKRVLRLIGKYLRAGVVVKGRLQRTPKGVPQGGPLSPLLANILLDDLDKELLKLGIPRSIAIPVCMSNKGLWRTFGPFTGNHVGPDKPTAEGSGTCVCQRTVGSPRWKGIEIQRGDIHYPTTVRFVS